MIAITNATGAIEERYKYDAHGNFEILIDSAFVSNRYFYAARDWEAEIKLYHNRARFYDPQNGFFIQRDPLGYVDGSNPYLYTSGNSVNYSDPLGMSEEPNWHHLVVKSETKMKDFLNKIKFNFNAKENGWILTNDDHKALHDAGWNDDLYKIKEDIENKGLKGKKARAFCKHSANPLPNFLFF